MNRLLVQLAVVGVNRVLGLLAVARWLLAAPLAEFRCGECGRRVTLPDLGGNPVCGCRGTATPMTRVRRR